MGMLYIARGPLMWKLFGKTFSAHGSHPLHIDINGEPW